MIVIFYVFKILLLVQFYNFLKVVYQAKKEDSTLKVSFGLLSYIEISILIGLVLSTLLSNYKSDYELFICIIMLVTNLYAYFIFRRIIITGDKLAVIRNTLVRIQNIRSVEADLYAVRFYEKNYVYKVFYPLINHKTLEYKLYRKLRHL